ncbi:MAG: hypothetical protein WCG80_09940 [Spirochaetales bacterium]
MKIFRRFPVWGLGLLFAVAAGLLAASCVVPLSGDGSGEAVIRLEIPAAENGRMLVGDATRYRLTIKPAKGVSKSVTFALGDTLVARTAPGEATLLLDAYDDADHLLTHGEATQTLASGTNEVSIELTPAVTMEFDRPVLLQPRQVTYLRLVNPDNAALTVDVSAGGASVWQVMADGTYPGKSATGNFSINFEPKAESFGRVEQGAKSGFLTISRSTGGGGGGSSGGQVQLTQDIMVMNSLSVVNRWGNDWMQVQFQFSSGISIDSVYLDGYHFTDPNGRNVQWKSDPKGWAFASCNSWWDNMSFPNVPIETGPHQMTIIMTDGKGNYWSVTRDYRLVETQPLVIATSSNFNAAIKTDGTLWTWAQGGTPAQMGTETTWRFVTVGTGHAAALKSDGTLWTWGDNSRGQLGLGDILTRSVPTVYGAIGNNTETRWQFVVAGYDHTLGAIKQIGNMSNTPYLMGWGQGASNAPVFEWEDFAQRVFVGDGFTLALKQGNKQMLLYGWGADDKGQLGDGQGPGTAMPTALLPTMTNWRDLATGSAHVLGLQNDGSLWTWGSNSDGQLGLGSSDNQAIHAPVMVTTVHVNPWESDYQWQAVAAGIDCSFALQYNGTLWAWGKTFTPTPAQIGTDSNWRSVVAGGQHVFLTRFDGTLWYWDTNKSAPVQVVL